MEKIAFKTVIPSMEQLKANNVWVVTDNVTRRVVGIFRNRDKAWACVCDPGKLNGREMSPSTILD